MFARLAQRFGTLGLVMSLFIFATPSVSHAQSNQCNNLLRNAVVTEYTSFYGDDFVPENLIDGNQNRSWSSAEGDTQPSITFDLGGTFEIDLMQLNGYFQANDLAYQGDSVRQFALEALVDEAWLAVVTGESPLQDRLIDYRLTDPVVTTHVRITFYSNHGGTAFEAAELTVCGERATATGGGASGGKRASGKENPGNTPLLLVQGNLAEGITDTWEIELKQGQVISIEFQATTRFTDIALYEPDGDRLQAAESYDQYIGNTWYTAMLGRQILIDGTYGLQVWGGLGPYTITVSDGYFGQITGTTAVDSRLVGNLAEYGIDRWLLPLSAGQIVSFEFQATTRFTDYQLFAPDGEHVFSAESYDAYIDNTFFSGYYAYQVLTEGLYMMRIIGGIGPYSLNITEGFFGEITGTVAIGQSVQGTLPENGYNRWLIALEAGDRITLDLEAALRFTDLRLFEPDRGTALTIETYNERGGRWVNSGQYDVLVGGLYAIQIWGGIGDYTLTVTER